MYTNVFYILWFTGLISYIYKPATSSHLKSGLLRWHLWLCSFLIPESLLHEDHRLCRLPNQISLIPRTSQIPVFKTSQVPDSRSSQVSDSRSSQVPDLRKFLIPELRRFQPSWNRQQIRTKEPDSAIIFAYYLKTWKHLKLIRIPSWMIRFHKTGIIIPIMICELTSRISANPTFWGCKVFPSSPTFGIVSNY
jgi:hypothetical protein